MIATYVLSVDVDEGVREDFAVNPINYTKSVDNYLGRYVLFVNYISFEHAKQLSGCGKSIANSMRHWGELGQVCDMKMLKRGGVGHDPAGVEGVKPGALGLGCPHCPQPGINLPHGWEKVAGPLK